MKVLMFCLHVWVIILIKYHYLEESLITYRVRERKGILHDRRDAKDPRTIVKCLFTITKSLAHLLFLRSVSESRAVYISYSNRANDE